MPRFFFTLEDHVRETDDRGTELQDAAQARIQAIMFAGEVLKNEPGLLASHDELTVKVTGECGGPVIDVIMRLQAP